MTAKEILAKVKAIFAEPVPPAPPVVPPVPPVPPVDPLNPPAPTGVDVEMEDGKMLHCSPDLNVGSTATIDGQPAPSGDHKLKDGSTVSVGENGLITELKAAEPVTTDAAAPQFAEAKTPEELKAMVDAFATGTPEERIAKLETVAKALMEYSFGWQIRENEIKALNEQAIAVYKTGLATAEAKLEKQEKVIEGLFELAEKLAETPTVEPVTLTGNKKEQFERTAAKEKRLEGIAASITQMRTKK
jgi:predicted component of type VI protein secretion system